MFGYDPSMTAVADLQTPADGDAAVLALVGLMEIVDHLGDIGHLDMGADDAAVIPLLDHLERVKGAAAAAQARLTASFDTRQHEAGSRSVGAQVALARRESPYQGGEHLRLARALVHDMPHTLAALTAGSISEDRAMILVRETEVLSRADRARVDAALADTLPGLGDRELADAARATGYALDPEAAERRFRKASQGRRVTCRPAHEPGMSLLTGRLPAHQGVAAFAALREHAEALRAGGDPRSLDQIMADTLVSRLTGEETPEGIGVEVELVVSESSLLGRGDEAARLPGYGSIPAGIARAIVAKADRAWLRRLFTAPETGELVAMDSRRRTFTGQLRHLVLLRDNRCRTPWCGAPIRHVDHVTPFDQGGPTSADNGQGLCEACNYLKERPGWTAERAGPGHEVVLRTPTGHPYVSKPLRLPGAIPADASPLERRLTSLTPAA